MEMRGVGANNASFSSSFLLLSCLNYAAGSVLAANDVDTFALVEKLKRGWGV